MPSDPKEDDNEAIPLSFWLLAGGTGPPPTISAFRHMALERKAAYREELSFKQTREDAIAKLEEEHGSLGLKGLIKRALGLEKRRTPDRKQLMAMFGGRENAVGNLRRGARVAAGGACVPAVARPVPDAPPPDVPVNHDSSNEAADKANGSANENNNATNDEALGAGASDGVAENGGDGKQRDVQIGAHSEQGDSGNRESRDSESTDAHEPLIENLLEEVEQNVSEVDDNCDAVPKPFNQGDADGSSENETSGKTEPRDASRNAS